MWRVANNLVSRHGGAFNGLRGGVSQGSRRELLSRWRSGGDQQPLLLLSGGRRLLSSGAAEGAVGGPLNAGVGKWLLGMGASVAVLVSVGGLTRLTHSGLSMVEWKPVTGWLPPLSLGAWRQEFEKYQAYPEFQLVNHDMGLDDFRSIYLWEYAHRLLGRLVGLGFAGGLLYHRKAIRGPLLASCTALLLGIGAQGALGWYMVKSGLEHDSLEHEPRVKATRLAAHLGAAFLLFSGMVWTGLGQLLPAPAVSKASSPALSSLVSRAAPFAAFTTGLVFSTAMSGALVAGTRAGFIYNTFPLMGGRLAPPATEYFALEPASRNLLENDTAIQFNHRVLAVLTIADVSLLTGYLLKHRHMLPRRLMVASNHLLAFGWVQVALGISTLVLVVPTHLASMHQMGSLAVLFSSLFLTKEVYLLKRVMHC